MYKIIQFKELEVQGGVSDVERRPITETAKKSIKTSKMEILDYFVRITGLKIETMPQALEATWRKKTIYVGKKITLKPI
ncbi:hypothetical protein [Thermospira aquatica]|uniref:Uncharacterized protein n=1 Tax=Thermospira aquatica TaxID=2828656 RepID=A0AAX3BDS9_9SPIR|nr:hypothetical protein [Thermospira aquatica]URA10427.1 hypothetical protein KDW03_01080 [Thermospira aquatica]